VASDNFFYLTICVFFYVFYSLALSVKLKTLFQYKQYPIICSGCSFPGIRQIRLIDLWYRVTSDFLLQYSPSQSTLSDDDDLPPLPPTWLPTPAQKVGTVLSLLPIFHPVLV
jgi:hypothetical protein